MPQPEAWPVVLTVTWADATCVRKAAMGAFQSVEVHSDLQLLDLLAVTLSNFIKFCATADVLAATPKHRSLQVQRG